jgi:uncharacterized ParB-like nuclease family protein
MDDQLYDRKLAQIASTDFERARRKAFVHDLVSLFSGRTNWLMAFEEVRQALPFEGQTYKGMQEVPVSQIVGSVDRYHDFDRAFLPTQTKTRPRWESVDRAALKDVTLPPVQLYKVGDIYFVKDGNHRVSVAREKGVEYIDAEVIELRTRVPLRATTDPRDLLKLGEYSRFLEATQLDQLRPGVDIQFSALGRYDQLLEHISAHRWYMGIEKNRPVSWEEAVLDWYDNIYMPMVKIIEENQILRDFPGRTAGDLYLWIMDHRWYLKEATGEDVGPEEAVEQYGEMYGGWTRKVLRYLGRLREAAVQPLIITGQRLARATHALDGAQPTANGQEPPEHDGRVEPAAPVPADQAPQTSG